jgi:hypothetical protein
MGLNALIILSSMVTIKVLDVSMENMENYIEYRNVKIRKLVMRKMWLLLMNLSY